MIRHWSLRTHLIFAVFTAGLPLIALIGYMFWSTARSDVERTQRSVEDVSRLTAAYVDRSLAGPEPASGHLDRLRSVLDPAPFGSGAVVTVVDGTGTVLLRAPDLDGWVGRSARDTDAVRRAMAGDRGYRAQGLDGVARHFGVATVPSTGWLVLVSAPVDSVVGKGSLIQRTALAGFGALTLAAVLAFYLAGSIERPVRRLARASMNAMAGEVTAPVPVQGPAEIAEVAAQFNVMLVSRQRAESALQETVQHLRTLINHAPLLVFEVDNSGTFLMVEGTVTDGAGGRPGASVGASIFEVYRDVPEIGTCVRRAFEGEPCISATVVNGMALDTSYVPVRDEAGEVVRVIGVSTDVTQRHRAEAQAAARARQQAAIADLGRVALTGADPAALMQECVARLRDILDVDLAGAFELTSDGSSLLLCAGSGWMEGDTGRQALSVSPDSPGGRTLSADAPVRLETGRDTSHPASPLLAEHDVVGGMMTAVQYESDRFGVLGVYTKAARDFTDDEVTFLQAVANLLATTIARARASAALAASESRYRSLVENAVEGIVRTSADGRIVDANAAFARILGYDSVQEVLALRLQNISVDRADVARVRNEFLAAGTIRSLELHCRNRDGTPITIILSARALRDDRGALLGFEGMILDVTERARAEEAQRFLAQATPVLAGTLDYQTILTAVADLAVPRLADWCTVELLTDDGVVQRLAQVHADQTSLPLLQSLAARCPIELEGPSVVASVLRTGEPVLLREVSPDDLAAVAGAGEQRDLLRAVGVDSLICVPLVARGRTLGAVTLATSGSGRRYDPADLALAEELARRAALAADNANLYEAEQRARRRSDQAADATARLQELTAALGGALTPEQVADVIWHEALPALGARGGMMAVLTPDGRTLEMVASSGYSEEQLAPWRSLSLSAELPLAEAVRNARLELVNDRAGIDRQYPSLRAFTEAVAEQALAAVPLVLDERVIGALGFGFRDPQRFSLHECMFMLALARQCAQALERARLYQEAQQAKDRYRDQKAELEGIIAHLSDGLMLADAAGAVTMVNPAACAILGIGTRDHHAPRPETECWHAVQPDGSPLSPRALPLARVLACERPPAGELHVIVNGEPRVLSVGAAPLMTAEGRLQGAVALFRDVTELRRTQDHAAESERLRALGEMASGVAHDFNNMLAVILGRCELLVALASRIEGGSVIAPHLEVVKDAARDGAATVKRLQTFSGVNRASADEAIDLAAIVQTVVEFSRPRWKDAAQQRGATIRMETDVAPLPPIHGNAAELREVLVNLVFNAVDAMPHGGAITLAVAQRGDEVTIQVKDDGTGMSEAVRRRIFEPFFSTKGTRGAGLGLSVSYGIITRMGGRIEVESALNVGTTFTITLPFRPMEPEAEDETPDIARPLSILLVDDEPQVLDTAALLLGIDGHRVDTASTGGEALALLRDAAEDGGYDAVLTDLGMPGMNGLQLISAIREQGLDVPCVLVTGWGLEVDAEDVHAAGAQLVLPKPFSVAQLREALGAIAS
jgi:PAS domain S-box-containing protein